MSVVLLLAALAILGGVVVVAIGRGGELTIFRPDSLPYPREFATAADVASFRPPPAFFGYSAPATDDALRRIVRVVAERDAELARLRGEIAALRGTTALRGTIGLPGVFGGAGVADTIGDAPEDEPDPAVPGTLAPREPGTAEGWAAPGGTSDIDIRPGSDGWDQPHDYGEPARWSPAGDWADTSNDTDSSTDRSATDDEDSEDDGSAWDDPGGWRGPGGRGDYGQREIDWGWPAGDGEESEDPGESGHPVESGHRGEPGHGDGGSERP